MKIFGISFKRKKKVILCPECKGTGRDKYDKTKKCSYCCYGIRS